MEAIYRYELAKIQTPNKPANLFPEFPTSQTPRQARSGANQAVAGWIISHHKSSY
jgi:hypothetical protein